MVKKAFTIKIDEQLLNKFKEFSDKVGLTPTAAIKLYMQTCIREKKIPLKLKVDK